VVKPEGKTEAEVQLEIDYDLANNELFAQMQEMGERGARESIKI